MNIPQFLINNRRKILLIVLSIIIISTIYSIISMVTKENITVTTPAIEVETLTIKPQDIVKKINTIGSIQYKDKAIISSKVFGRVEKIYVEQGNKVKNGQALARIETYPLELQLKEATAELEKAKANCRLAEEKLMQAERTVEQRLKAIAKSKLELLDKYVTLKNTEDVLKKKEQLFKVGGITETELNSLKTNHHTIKTQFLQAKKDYETLVVGYRDSDIKKAGITIPKNEKDKNNILIQINTAMEKSECDAAKSHVQQVSTQIEIIKTNIKEATIVSPINGTVALRSIDIGEKVTDETNLFVIINTMQVYCIAQINEKDLLHIKTNQSVELTVDALENKKFNGKVSIISPILDQSSRTAEIKILCNNNDSQLRPGMFARASIFTQTIKDAIIIPVSSIKESDTTNVFIIKNNLALQKKVTIQERINEEYALINDGLQEGDIIASSSIKLLYDKAKIKIVRQAQQNKL